MGAGEGNLLITSTQVLRAIPKINKQALELVLMTLGYTKGSLNRLHIKTFVDSEKRLDSFQIRLYKVLLLLLILSL